MRIDCRSIELRCRGEHQPEKTLNGTKDCSPSFLAVRRRFGEFIGNPIKSSKAICISRQLKARDRRGPISLKFRIHCRMNDTVIVNRISKMFLGKNPPCGVSPKRGWVSAFPFEELRRQGHGIEQVSDFAPLEKSWPVDVMNYPRIYS